MVTSQNTVWKQFNIGDLFFRSTDNALKTNQKDLSITEIIDDEHDIALISASKVGCGRVGYVSSEVVKRNNVEASVNKLTFDDQWGFTFFQKEPFVITGGHNAVLEVKDIKLKQFLEKNLYIYPFLALLINKITIKSGLFGYTYKINNKLDREKILLPCVYVLKDKEYIWEDSDGKYTFDISFVKRIMSQAKKNREEKTIKLYKMEQRNYSNELKKYEDKYLQQKKDVVWKNVKFGDIFIRKAPPSVGVTAKELDIYEEKKDGTIALITRAETNNGIRGYIVDNNYAKSSNTITYNDQFSFFLYHDYEFTTIKDHLSVITTNSREFNNMLKNNPYFSKSIVKILNKVFNREIFDFNFTGADYRYDRELALLPCIETNEQTNFIFEEQNKKYTLAFEYIIYIYLLGEIKRLQRLIDNYSYQY